MCVCSLFEYQPYSGRYVLVEGVPFGNVSPPPRAFSVPVNTSAHEDYIHFDLLPKIVLVVKFLWLRQGPEPLLSFS